MRQMGRVPTATPDQDQPDAGDLIGRRGLAQQDRGQDDRRDRLAEQDQRRHDRRQVRQRSRDEQPAADLGADREQEQPAVPRPGRHQDEIAQQQPADDAADHRGRRRVADRADKPARRPCLAEQEQVAGVGEGGHDAVAHAQAGVPAVGPAAEHPGDEHDPEHGQRGSEQDPAGRPFAQQEPGDDAHDDHLEVAHHRRQTRPDLADGQVERGQVDREEQPRAQRQQPGAAIRRPQPALLRQGARTIRNGRA